MPRCPMLIKAPGNQRKETFANHSQVFHNAMLLLENIVLFHSSHHSTPHRDTGHSPQCHCGKTCLVKHPSQWARQFNTLCKESGMGGVAQQTALFLSSLPAPLLPNGPISALWTGDGYQAAPTLSCPHHPVHLCPGLDTWPCLSQITHVKKNGLRETTIC